MFSQSKKSYLFGLVVLLAAWHSAVCLLGLMTGLMYATTHIYGPTRKYEPDDREEILDDCETVTTDDKSDLILADHEISQDEAFELFDEHGVAIIPSILSRQTAQSLRDFVQTANPEMRQVFVLKKDNRYRIMPTPFDEAIVAQAMREIGTHPTLKPLLDNILGPKSSLISFSVITSKYGAKAQNWHRDTPRSAMTHPDDLIHEVTLTIPLQDTTEEMGATGICPGTHQCAWIEDVYPDVPKQESIPCNITADLLQGDGLLYHTDVIHRGPAHVDPDAPDRSVLFVSFAESKTDKFKRLAYGKVYSLDYRLWGLTLDDFPHLGNWWWKWSFLHPLGIRFFGYGENDHKSAIVENNEEEANLKTRPWNAADAFFHIFDRRTKFHMLDSSFDSNQAKRASSKIMMAFVGFAGLYLWIGIPLWVYAIWQWFQGRRNLEKKSL